MKRTSEHAFETYVEEILSEHSGLVKLDKDQWDKEHALFPKQILDFIAKTQTAAWQELEKLHGSLLNSMLINTLIKELDVKGSLHVLRHGFKFYGKTLKLAYFKPAHGLNEEIIELYDKNQLAITRQVLCHPNDNSTIDMLISLNGLPVATIELKNPWTGQNWRHAIKQYCEDRDPNAPLFAFKKRALVHFAADPEEIHMTTRLARGKTFFLPFNRGSAPGTTRCGAGNPNHPSGYETGYFWEETLQKDTVLDILGHYIYLERIEEKITDANGKQKLKTKETMIFPRYHQFDAVRNLISAAGEEGSGNNYLIQHSAGSGKTNSISWLSHRLASLHNERDEKVFDCVVVITDRQVLDRQLQDAIYQIEHAQGVVKAIDEDSKQLAEALIDGTKIVVTTLQKFPFVLRGLLYQAGAKKIEEATVAEKERANDWQQAIARRKYALIVDEAHSSQSGETARELKAILGTSIKKTDEEETDWEDGLNEVMASRGKQTNLSYFAFTATPKGKTLEVFGRPNAEGKPAPFHLYSMRQAIEERFILDVVKNYTTYKTFFRLAKTVTDDPTVPKKKAALALKQYMVMHPHNISQKTALIIEHFRHFVKPHLNGKAKAMVVTSSRMQAVRYMLAFQNYIEEKQYADVRPLVAFSGTVKDPDTQKEYTEPGMNIDIIGGKKIGEKRLKERFASPDYQILLVANKYQTGFDQPLLMAMYVDKRLDGVQAVQTLSRLNRMIPGKAEPFVLDFVNSPEDIHNAFKPYYDATSVQDVSDPQQLEQLKHELDQAQVYHWNEVEAFAKVFYKLPAHQRASDHSEMKKHLNPAKGRYLEIQDLDARLEFRDKLAGYVRVYSFLSHILPFTDPELEMLYSFGRLLLPLLPRDNSDQFKVADPAELEYYRLQRVFSGPIDLAEGESEGVKSPTDVGTRKATEPKVPLSEIIDKLNEQFSTNFSEEDRLFFEQIKERASKDEQIIKTALANPLDKFQLGIRALIEELMVQRMAENDKIVTRYMDDKNFQDVAFPLLTEAIFETVHKSVKDGEIAVSRPQTKPEA